MSLPFQPREALGGWSVVAVQYERRRVRVRLQQGATVAGLSLHPVEGHPHAGPFDNAGFRIYTEGNALPIALLEPAGRAIAGRLAGIPPAAAGRTMRAWARRSRGNGSGPETFDADGPPEEWLEDIALHLAEGGQGARLRGPIDALAQPAALAGLARHQGAIRLEPVVEGAPQVDQLRTSLARLAGAGLRVNVVVVPDAASVATLSGLISLLVNPLHQPDGTKLASPVDSVAVQVPAVQDLDSRGRQPPRLSALSAALSEAHRAGVHRVRFSSRVGEPACLFPTALKQALLVGGGEGARSQVPSRQGPECERCSLKATCPGVSAAYAERFGTGELVPFVSERSEPTWKDRARWLLVGRTGESIKLSDVMPREEIPRWACHLPWTRLELGDGGPVGPCCMEFQVRPKNELVPLGKVRAEEFGIRDQAETPEELWNGPRLRSFRRAMTHGGHPETCRETCPPLVGGTFTPDKMLLWGGPAESVEGQLTLVEDMLAGAEVARNPPQTLCITTTSYCNYKCVMCDFHERGTLADEKPDRFWTELEKWLGALQQIDANGGEPLASPSFRTFLERADFKAYPQLGISLTTNLSYLTPRQLEKFAHVPLASLTISVNAATPETYEAVMRGLPMDRWRENMEAVLRRRAESPSPLGLTYSFVILKLNVHEVYAFYEFVKKDDVYTRYMLPMRDLNEASIMTSEPHMVRARDELLRVAADMKRRGREFEHGLVMANVGILEQRLADRIFAPL
jgi:molybdenum cofactor biosynthesis enzyme MoaA